MDFFDTFWRFDFGEWPSEGTGFSGWCIPYFTLCVFKEHIFMGEVEPVSKKLLG